MNQLEEDAVAILAPAASYALGLMFPAIPAMVWATIFVALKNGDLTAAAFDGFLAEHGLKTYASLADYPGATPCQSNQSNVKVEQPPS